jgi:hypothetical protein
MIGGSNRRRTAANCAATRGDAASLVEHEERVGRHDVGHRAFGGIRAADGDEAERPVLMHRRGRLLDARAVQHSSARVYIASS